MSITYSSPAQFPESLDWDAKGNRFILGSVAKGTLDALAPDGKVTNLVKDGDYAGSATLGTQVDLPRNRVITTIHSNNPAAPYDGVAAYDLDTGARLFLVDLAAVPAPDPPRKGLPPFANDAVSAPDGTVYVTDTNRSLLWRVDADGSNPVVFASHALFDDFPVLYQGAWDLGLNGIVVVPSGEYIVTSSVRNGRFFKVPVDGSAPSVVEFTDGATFPGIDGIRLRPDGRLVAVSHDSAWLIEPSADWSTAKLLETKPLKGEHVATAVAIRDGVAYANYAHFGEVFTGKVDRSEFVLEKVEFDFDAK